jgi:hypothetical protein
LNVILKPIQVIDPKTGKEGVTVPDAFKNGGQSTSEVKNVKSQSLSEQLRLQEKFSNDNGFKPELIINASAKLSKPLRNSSFEIKTYSAQVPIIDNVGSGTNVFVPVELRTKQQAPIGSPSFKMVELYRRQQQHLKDLKESVFFN